MLDGNTYFLEKYLQEQDAPVQCEGCGHLVDNEELDRDGWCGACLADKSYDEVEEDIRY